MKAFPENFAWGAMLLAHKVEGGNFNSDWWRWEQRPNRVVGGATSQLAAGHWDSYADDIRLAKSFGMKSLVISLEWSRIQLDLDQFDSQALNHYRAALETVRRCGMTPVCILQSVTTPKWFAERYGWHNRNAPKLFATYTERVGVELGHLATYWIPVFEPMNWVSMAYLERAWPPGSRRLDHAFKAFRNLVRAHRYAHETLRRQRPDALVGVSVRARAFKPLDDQSPWDVRIARHEQFRCNRLFLHAALGNTRFPVTVPTRSGVTAPDFVLVSYSGVETVCFAWHRPDRLFSKLTSASGAEVDHPEPEDDQASLIEVLRQFSEYGIPLFVSTGRATSNEADRARLLLADVRTISRAMQEGAPAVGYFYESLIDGFEWTKGYSEHRGLFHVDRETLARTPNPAAFLYKELCQTGTVRRGTVEKLCGEAASERATASR